MKCVHRGRWVVKKGKIFVYVVLEWPLISLKYQRTKMAWCANVCTGFSRFSGIAIGGTFSIFHFDCCCWLSANLWHQKQKWAPVSSNFCCSHQDSNPGPFGLGEILTVRPAKTVSWVVWGVMQKIKMVITLLKIVDFLILFKKNFLSLIFVISLKYHRTELARYRNVRTGVSRFSGIATGGTFSIFHFDCCCWLSAKFMAPEVEVSSRFSYSFFQHFFVPNFRN